MSKNNKKSLILSIVTVLVLGIIITTSTFAYLQWSGGQTSVNVTIQMGGITMHIEPEETSFVGLYPTKISSTADCSRARYGDALVTIENNTGTLAIPSFKLKVKVTKGGSDALTKEALSHINYVVIPLETTKNAIGKPVKGDPMNNYSCYSIPYGSDSLDVGGGVFSNSEGWSTHFKFESASTSGAWSHVPNYLDESHNGFELYNNPAYLPRQYYSSDSPLEDFKKGDVQGITFRGEAYSTSYQYFRVYVWIDEEYTTTIIGNQVTDPLQNAKIEITWSEESIVQQVSGESNVESVQLASGLYDNDGNMTYTWDELVANDYVTMDDMTVVSVDLGQELSGKIVISEEVTNILYGAFWGSISSVDLSRNTNITHLVGSLFRGSNVNTVIISSSITSIGYSLFEDKVDSEAYIYYDGTKAEWNAIDKVDGWNVYSVIDDYNGIYTYCSITVVCTDGIIEV